MAAARIVADELRFAPVDGVGVAVDDDEHAVMPSPAATIKAVNPRFRGIGPFPALLLATGSGVKGGHGASNSTFRVGPRRPASNCIVAVPFNGDSGLAAAGEAGGSGRVDRRTSVGGTFVPSPG